MKILGLLLSFVFTSYLFSVPYFSRKYEISCSNCHTIAPDLNKKGEDFLRKGYKLEGKKDFEDKINIKDDFLYLSKAVPISFLLDLKATAFEKMEFNDFNREYEKKSKADFQFPYTFKLLSGGILYKNISYYLSYLKERSVYSSFLDFYLYIKLFNSFPLYLKFGQFPVSDQLFKSNLKEEENDYNIFIESPNYSTTNLYYDRGIQFIYSKSNLDFIFGVYNGNNRFQFYMSSIVLPNPYNVPNVNEYIEYDYDYNKNYSFRIKKVFSNSGFGLFYYSGRDNWKITVFDGDYRQKWVKNKLYYIGFDFTTKIKEKIKINAQYIERNDDNLSVSPYYYEYTYFKNSKLKGGFFEILFFPKRYEGNYVFYLLYNKGNSQLPEFTFYNRTQEYYELDFSNISFGFNYLFSRNTKLLLEYRRNFKNELNKFTVGFLAFF